MKNEEINKLCEVNKGVNEKINGSILIWFGHVERKGGSRLAKWMYRGIELSSQKSEWIQWSVC